MKEYCRACCDFTVHRRGFCARCLAVGSKLRVGLIVAACLLAFMVAVFYYWIKHQ